MAEGTITRRDIISDDALSWGKDYVANLEGAISKNKEFVQAIIALNDANNGLKLAKTQKELEEATAKANAQGQRALKIWKEQDQLEQNLISTKRKNQLATESTNQALIKERALLAETNLEIKRQAIANGLLESSYKKLSAQVTLAGNKVKDIIATGKLASESQEEYNKRLAKAQAEFDKLNSRVRAADAAVGQFNRNVGNYPQAAYEGIKKLIEAFGVVTGIQLFVSVMKDAFVTVREFEKEMVNLGAIAGKSRAEIAPLEAKIRDVAKSSINGATDVAKLATELIKLGSTTDEAEKLLEPVNNLSVALQATAEDSATLVKSILNAYGEGAEEAGRVTDILAESANRSALDFQGLRDSFSYLAPAARALGIPIEKTAAIIGTLADNGIKAESAGRLTSTAFARLANQGLTLEDALGKINKAQKDGSDQLEVLALASNLFGAEAGKIGLILANNTEKINESTLAYENSEGALKSLTDKQLKSLDSELKILSSAWEDYILDTNEASGASSALSGGIRFLSGNLKTIIDVLTIITTAWLAYRAALVVASLQQKLLALGTVETTVAQTANTTATVAGTAAQTANTVATTGATTAWQRFNTALKANALMLIITALASAIYALDKFNESVDVTAARTKESSENFLKNREQLTKTAASTKQLTDRYGELQEKAKKLGGETKLTAEEQKEMQRIVSELAKVVPGAVTAVNKYGEALKLNEKLLAEYNKENAKVLEIDKKKAINDEIKLQKELADQIKFQTKALQNYRKYEGEGSITTAFIAQEERKLSVYKTEAILSKGRLADLKGLSQAEKETAKAEDARVNNKVANLPRTIEVIDAEIKAQEELVKGLSDKSGKEGRAIKAKIAALTAEREQIYSTARAEKEKQDNGLKNAKKVNDAIYQLSQFRYQNEINNNQKIIDSENATNEERINALLEIQQLQESKNGETLRYDLLRNALEKDGLEDLSKEKLAIYKKDAQARIESIISGKVANEKLTNEEKLILEKYYAEKKALEEKGATDKQAIIDSEVARVQKGIDAQLLAEDTKMQKTLDAENILYRNALEAANGNNKLIQQAEEEHQRRLIEIKKNAAKEALQLQINELQGLLNADSEKEASARISTEKRKELENKLAKAQTDLNALQTDDFKENLDERAIAQEQFNEQMKEIGMQLRDALLDFANALFAAKISNIDAEIQANDDYYNREIEAAGNNEALKTLLENERERKRVALEKKKRKAEYDAAVFQKATQAAQIIGATSLAVISALAQVPKFDFGISANAIAAIYAGIGAVQLATLLATPLPKYKTGRKDGPEEWAIVGDGYKKEVLSDPDGSNPIVTPSKPTLVKLAKGQKVHSSIGAYEDYVNASIIESLENQSSKTKDYIIMNNDSGYSAELLEELKRNTDAVRKNKPIINNKIDFGYQIWRMSNINWNRP
jgi:hypothetical protein